MTTNKRTKKEEETMTNGQYDQKSPVTRTKNIKKMRRGMRDFVVACSFNLLTLKNFQLRF